MVKLALALVLAAMATGGSGEPARLVAARDGAHDFDFLIGDWSAHVRRLPERLVGSTRWDVYDGVSNHHKVFDTSANLEKFDVRGPAGRIKAQTLRMYDPASRQWSIYGLDLDAGTILTPGVTGEFRGKRGEFYHQEPWRGRVILVRYLWLDLGPQAARMEQAYSDDGGATWETNWICELSR